jgi:hypothetical protein
MRITIFIGFSHDLHVLKDWLNMNKPSLKTLTCKTKSMFIASRQKLAALPNQPLVEIDGNKIERDISSKSLDKMELENLSNKFTSVSPIHSCGLRRSDSK